MQAPDYRHLRKVDSLSIILLKTSTVLHYISRGGGSVHRNPTQELSNRFPHSPLGKYLVPRITRRRVNTASRHTSRSYRLHRARERRKGRDISVRNARVTRASARAGSSSPVYQTLFIGMWLYMFFKFSNFLSEIPRATKRALKRLSATEIIDNHARHTAESEPEETNAKCIRF